MIGDAGIKFPFVVDGQDFEDGSFDFSHFQKMAALGELASGIIHDFRNVLQMVSASLELIGDRSDSPSEVRRLAAAALMASDRGIGVTQRLAKFSRAQRVDVRPTCLVASLESATATLARTIEAKMKVAIEPVASDLWQALIDPTEFEVALINLGINARDAMPNGGYIRLRAYNVTVPSIDRRAARAPIAHSAVDRRGPQLPLPGGDYVAISVVDTGTGMDKATLDRAVKPFFTTKPVGKGTGLGLAMAHTLATQAGGTLRLTSEIGRGTKVEIWLPRASASPASVSQTTFIAA